MIAAGKDRVTQFLVDKGWQEINVDRIGHQVTAAMAAQLAQLFGDAVLTADGKLDRRELGRLVFADEEKRQLLNRTVHPPMCAEVRRRVESCNGCAVINCALLYQMELDRLCDRVWFVTAPRETLLERIVLRDNLSRNAAEQRLNRQKDINRYRKFADEVIENRGSLPELQETLVALYREISGGCTDGTTNPQAT